MRELTAQIKQLARRIGFDLVGIAPAAPTKYRQYLRDWLASGQAGAMQYLAQRFEERADPGVYVAGARSVICVALNYHAKLAAPTAADGQARGRIARYALGEDYHEVIKKRLHQLADWIRNRCPDATMRAAVDTAPVMEKELAARAGVGWIGKNACVINPRMGSWLLLGEIITTLDLPADEPAVDRCGDCRRCIDACPTGAITSPYQLDARRCISYLTIELREEIPREFHQPIGQWLFGCDICQEVCPWNGKAPVTHNPAFAPRFEDGRIDLEGLLGWGQEDYQRHLQRSAMKRVKLPVLVRNAKLVLKNLSQAKQQI